MVYSDIYPLEWEFEDPTRFERPIMTQVGIKPREDTRQNSESDSPRVNKGFTDVDIDIRCSSMKFEKIRPQVYILFAMRVSEGIEIRMNMALMRTPMILRLAIMAI
ncbi:hypothetical protein [Rhodohalobacter sp.]|uniref:hypothetical protein n=1 Tax=Rhodohalobacter sp. TaxID=1974210 RepID=UPI002ACE13AD|nr:hypothetical protein [Rhodohalobacter sp.]MDZ7758394.1 hypothetical protein [Rhodohalobacter sp.]